MSKRQSDFGSEHDLTKLDRLLIQAYVTQGVSLDALAYTDDFEAIYKKISAAGYTDDRAAAFRRLLNFRKAGQLPRLDFSKSA